MSEKQDVLTRKHTRGGRKETNIVKVGFQESNRQYRITIPNAYAKLLGLKEGGENLMKVLEVHNETITFERITQNG